MQSKLLIQFLLFLLPLSLSGQSLELMVGNQRVFADVQWLKPFDKEFRWTLFSRTRGTVDYKNNTDLFSGAYLNYTTKSGLGVSLVGRIGATGTGSDIGIHLFKANDTWTLFALASISLQKELQYSWFSILRFTPELNENWRFYSSLELFSIFNKAGHAFSVQRLRAGVSWGEYTFGLANNLSEIGPDFGMPDNNFGVFWRKSFN
ncbi:MAG: hypothetical protein AAFR87_06725 [Bacteroidota bacterium]